MLKFVFLVTFWHADGTPPDVYAEDTNLTGEDCIARIEEHVATGQQGHPSCEVDEAAPR